MSGCECAWCVTPATIAKRHAESSRRERLGHVYAAHVYKVTGTDLTKREGAGVAHTSRTGYDDVTVSMLAKAGVTRAGSAERNVAWNMKMAAYDRTAPVHDPNWDRLLAVHAAAATGDPVAVSAWAAVEGFDPGVAKLVPEVAQARRPRTVGKAKKGRKSVGAVKSHDDRPEFEQYVRGLAGYGGTMQAAALKALGSQGGPRLPEGPGGYATGDPDVDEFEQFMGSLRRSGTVPASTPTPSLRRR